MKEEKLLDALNEIDDEFIEEAKPQAKKKGKIKYFKWIAAAACMILAVGIGVTLNHISNIYDGSVISEEETTTAFATESNEEIFEEGNTEFVIEEATNLEGEIQLIDKDFWKNLSIDRQYNNISYKSSEYYNNNTILSKQDLGKKISSATATGQDPFDLKIYTKEVTVYSLKDISDKIAVAVKFEENDNFFVYVNRSCEFNTLGEFTEELCLKDNMKISAGYYKERDVAQIKYEKIDSSVILEMLLKDTTLKAVGEPDDRILIPDFSVTIEISPFNSSEVIAVTKDGYLIINVFHSQSIFFIGREKTENFIDYVMENYKGKKLVYTTDAPVVYNSQEEEIPVTEVISNGYEP